MTERKLTINLQTNRLITLHLIKNTSIQGHQLHLARLINNSYHNVYICSIEIIILRMHYVHTYLSHIDSQILLVGHKITPCTSTSIVPNLIIICRDTLSICHLNTIT